MTTLGSALEAFIREHEYCGQLDTGLEGHRVWMTCTCAAAIRRLIFEQVSHEQ
jgi:hypothetical protein